MIGVSAHPRDLGIAAEFFELFKTAWEPVRPGRHYDAVLSTDGRDDFHTDLLVLYGSATRIGDLMAPAAVRRGAQAQWNGFTIPLFGDVALFAQGEGPPTVMEGESQYACGFTSNRVRGVGYNLFDEVRHLLTEGQPEAFADVPTLELHIALLRSFLIEARIPFVEVLPRPNGCEFICCLTHDIDFFGIRRHLPFDRTIAGFVFRGALGSLLDVIRGRRSLHDAFQNLIAVCLLPFVQLGFVPDPWRPFDHYLEVEDPTRSTFFLVPFRDQPGIGPDGSTDRHRAVRYQATDVKDEAQAAAERGSELAVHGIDAWRDAVAGRAERNQLASIVPGAAGVRMHWLYWSNESPGHLEAAGYTYDSTWGYNDTIGYRAGTSQAFRLPGTTQLLELPLTIMDSALLASDRQALEPDHAVQLCRRLIAQARAWGGTLVINWHCRSLAPERLWRQPYVALLADIAAAGASFLTAGGAVDWFRWRRSITLTASPESVVSVQAPTTAAVPAVIRVYEPVGEGQRRRDIPFDGRSPVVVASHPNPFALCHTIA